MISISPFLMCLPSLIDVNKANMISLRILVISNFMDLYLGFIYDLRDLFIHG